MGIQTEFNPDLALRDIKHFKEGKRRQEECIPEPIEEGKVYSFLKEGQRLYWLQDEIPLVKTEGNGKIARPLASVIILEATHFLDDGKMYTRGKYIVKEVFHDDKVKFEAYYRIKQSGPGQI